MSEPTTDAAPDGGTVSTPEDAIERARAALAAVGYDDATVAEEPFRTTTTWVVPARTAAASCNVHVDAADGSTRVARIER